MMVGRESISSIASARSGTRSSSQFAWELLGLLGFALFVVGGSDFLLSWFPWRFGNPEWEFGTITAALNAMPAGLMGLTLLLVWAHQGESAVWTRVLSGVILIWALALIALAVIYGLTLPLAARGFAVPNVGVGLKRAIARSLVQLVIYPVVMVWMAARGFRQARSIT